MSVKGFELYFPQKDSSPVQYAFRVVHLFLSGLKHQHIAITAPQICVYLWSDCFVFKTLLKNKQAEIYNFYVKSF